jgi:hypothetical protein
MNRAVAEHNSTSNWESAIGTRVRAVMASPEMDRYFNVKMTTRRAHCAIAIESLCQLPPRLLGESDR